MKRLALLLLLACGGAPRDHVCVCCYPLDANPNPGGCFAVRLTTTPPLECEARAPCYDGAWAVP